MFSDQPQFEHSFSRKPNHKSHSPINAGKCFNICNQNLFTHVMEEVAGYMLPVNQSDTLRNKKLKEANEIDVLLLLLFILLSSIKICICKLPAKKAHFQDINLGPSSNNVNCAIMRPSSHSNSHNCKFIKE